MAWFPRTLLAELLALPDWPAVKASVARMLALGMLRQLVPFGERPLLPCCGCLLAVALGTGRRCCSPAAAAHEGCGTAARGAARAVVWLPTTLCPASAVLPQRVLGGGTALHQQTAAARSLAWSCV